MSGGRGGVAEGRCARVCRVKVNFRKLCEVDNLCKNLKIFLSAPRWD